MSRNEINLREARARIGYLVERAEHAGEITIITRHGHPAAAIVPIGLVPRESPVPYTLSIIEGESPYSTGTDLADAGLTLDAATWTWLEEHGYGTDHPDRWVLVTPADEDPGAGNVIASRRVTI